MGFIRHLPNFEIDHDANNDPVIRNTNTGEEITLTTPIDLSVALTVAGALTADSADITNTMSAGTADVDTLTATDATVANSPTAENDVAIKSYVDSVAQGLDWQDSVLDELNDPPASPATGDRYLVDDNPTGDWSGHPNEIAEWDGSAWEFFTPNEGWATYVEDIDLLKVYTADSGDWIQFGSAIDHGALAGLADDDHTQYVIQDGSRTASAIANQDYNEPVVEVTAQTGTVTLDLAASNRHRVEADGDITIAFSNVSASPPGNSVIIYLYDSDGTGPHTVSWPTGTEWPGGSVTNEIASGSNVEVALTSDDGGSTWRATERGAGFQ